MDIDINEVELVLLPGKCPPKQYLDHYLKTYYCWREVWEETFKREMNIDSVLTSDEFTRQDEVLALFHKGECTALCFFKWVDGAEAPTVHDSYFESWPELAMTRLCSQGPRILVCSQFTVHPKYRKNNSNISLKDLLMALLVERFRHSDRDVMTGTMRLKKNMGETTYRTGATPLMKGLHYKAEETVDLVGFFQNKVTDSVVPGIPEIVGLVFPKVISLAMPVLNLKVEVKNAA